MTNEMDPAVTPTPSLPAIPMTRHTLENDLMRAYLEQNFPDVALKSNEALYASIREVLAARPQGAREQGGVFLFAYGSLIWNPCVTVDDLRTARIYGYHRDFCLKLTHGRGSEDSPGVMLALKPGGSCCGAAIHIPEDALERDLILVWRREMLTSAYVARWVRLTTQQGPIWAIAFVANPRHERFIPDMQEDQVIDMLSTGHGVLGSCRDYLHNTVSDLRSLEIHDRRLENLAARVDEIRQLAPY